MRKISLCVLLLIVLLFSSALYGYDRYVHSLTSMDGDEYYIDTQSLSFSKSTNTVRFWSKNTVTQTSRKAMISSTRNKKRKAILLKLTETKTLIEINLPQNTYRIIEKLDYNSKGRVIDSLKSSYIWDNIAPNSIIEGMRNTVIQILQNEVYSTNEKPQFITPPPPPGLTQAQQKSWYKLQEYNEWLYSRPDFDEFNQWYIQKLQKAGVTAEQVNADLYKRAMQNGGDFSIIPQIIQGWYREFQTKRYGR